MTQGYARVGVSAALNTAQSLAEICASVLVLAVLPPPAAGCLAALGGASIVTAALTAAAGAPAASGSSVRAGPCPNCSWQNSPLAARFLVFA